MNEPVHILSLGAGVQSSTLALMADMGVISPRPLCGIFADTEAEPASVYAWLDWLEKQLSYPVYRVTAGSLTTRITTTQVNRKTGREYYSNMIPAFTLNKDGSRGIVGRSCTTNFKIVPITRRTRGLVGDKKMRDWRKEHRIALRELSEYERRAALWRKHKKDGFAGVHPNRPVAAFEECQADPLVIRWIGISLDEASRMKPSREPWEVHRWPLVEMRMTRNDCLRWMKAHGYPEPPRSACVYCPFHSDAEWRRLRDDEPEAFAEAVRVEKALQAAHQQVKSGQMKGLAFLHDSLVPLDKVDFSTDEDHGQQVMFKNECEGMCGV